jgi:hypothetical protein
LSPNFSKYLSILQEASPTSAGQLSGHTGYRIAVEFILEELTRRNLIELFGVSAKNIFTTEFKYEIKIKK